MSEPVVTILMPVYNGARYLQEALDSIWAQSFSDFELLVVDDGSTDETNQILSQCRDPRLRVLQNSRRMKLSGALNRGMMEAGGAFIARMDADDLMRPDRLARQVRFMTQHPGLLISGGWMQAFGDKHQVMKYPLSSAAIRAQTLFYAPFGHPSVMFRRERLIAEGWRYDGQFYPSEDYELWSRLLVRHQGRNLSRVLLDYRVHGASMTGGEWSDMDQQTSRIQSQMLLQLGLQPSHDDLRVHRLSSVGRMPPIALSFHQASSWLGQLRDANQETSSYDARSLEQVLSHVWYRMTMGVVRPMGLSAWRHYRHLGRPFRLCRSRHDIMVFMASLKASLLRRTTS